MVTMIVNAKILMLENEAATTVVSLIIIILHVDSTTRFDVHLAQPLAIRAVCVLFIEMIRE